jgi:hypothetical protein
MSFEHFKCLVDQVKDMGAKIVCPFGFGEPLLDKGIFEKIEYCTKKGLETFITSNAYALDTEAAFNLLRSGLSHIRFSVHGITPEGYRKVHRKNTFDLVIRHIYNFIAINKKKYGNQCKVSVSVIPQNGEKIDDIRAMWEQYVDWLEIWRPHNWSNLCNYRKLNKKKGCSCGRPFFGPIQINCDGKMMICCFDFDAKMTIGNTYNDSIENILKGEPLKIIQEKHKKGDFKGLPCEHCDQIYSEVEPLLYSNRDKTRAKNVSSTTKIKIGGNL